jgi:hypothetical protein
VLCLQPPLLCLPVRSCTDSCRPLSQSSVTRLPQGNRGYGIPCHWLRPSGPCRPTFKLTRVPGLPRASRSRNRGSPRRGSLSGASLGRAISFQPGAPRARARVASKLACLASRPDQHPIILTRAQPPRERKDVDRLPLLPLPSVLANWPGTCLVFLACPARSRPPCRRRRVQGRQRRTRRPLWSAGDAAYLVVPAG